jgi:hypothetical protein
MKARLPWHYLALLAALVTSAFPARAHAQASPMSVPHPYAYGVLVGSNLAGSGQKPLRYAEDDARRMAEVFRELGRFGSSNFRVLPHPDAQTVLKSIDDFADKLKEHQQKGEQAIFVFYYSGHARANAFNLGAEELAVTTVRERLMKLPATLTLVVLDACQSGRFVRTKGAEPAADFSFNSVSRLTTKGTVVMASSSAEELSQESDEIRASYFTHHLVVGLRGAADTDKDGRISLDEAYRYAYRRTLASTAQTQVGSQHVTLETDLAGQGELPVTYPADAKSQLELPAPLEARVLVQHKPSGNVVAEVQKAPGTPLRLAFASGSYEAIVRSNKAVLKCSLSLVDERVAVLDTALCMQIHEAGVAKGDEPPPSVIAPEPRYIEPWSIETGIGMIWRTEDAYTDRLREFGYSGDRFLKSPRARASIAFFKGFTPHLEIGGEFHTLAGDKYTRQMDNFRDDFVFDAYGTSLHLRGMTYLTRGRKNSYIAAYGRLGAGVAMAVTTLGTVNGNSEEIDWGFVVGGMGGFMFQTRGWFGMFVQGGYEYAPIISNLIGDTHNSGGPSVQLGTRFRLP